MRGREVDRSPAIQSRQVLPRAVDRVSLPNEHSEACRQKCCEEKERIAESARRAGDCAPGCGVPADDDQSASQYQREPPFSRRRKLLSQDDRGDQSDEQRHATRVERALVVSGCKISPLAATSA